MRKRFLAALAVCAVVLGLAGSVAWASGTVAVDIPFSFMVKDKEMAAGHYEIQVLGDESKLTIRSAKGGSLVVPVIERLADTGATEPKVVFDKTDDGKNRLSEVHIPGKDGFLVGIAKGKETHVTVTGKE